MSGQDEERPRPVPTPDTGSFWRGFLGAGLPIIALSLLSVAGDINESVSGLVSIWYLGAFAWVAALGAMINNYRAGKSNTGTGILAALAIGLLVLGTTCFANLNGPALNGL